MQEAQGALVPKGQDQTHTGLHHAVDLTLGQGANLVLLLQGQETSFVTSCMAGILRAVPETEVGWHGGGGFE